MNTDRVISKKLSLLDEYLQFLEEMKSVSLEDFLKDKRNYGSVERFLQLSIEILIDIGNCIISKNKLGTTDWYQDIAILFYENHYIDSEVKDTWIQMIKFRNLLVHEYAVINKKEVYNILQNHLSDIIKIQKIIIERFL